jgi:NIMA (never in mitosis gene a)-related kinase
MQLDEMEEKYGPAYEKLLPFMTIDERKKFVPLILTFIITG